MSDPLRLDDLDRGIVVALERNARATFADVGGQVGLSAPAVKRRVDRLLARGVITGFRAVVDPEALGWTTEAFVELFCHGRTSARQLADLVARHPEVTAAYTVTGDANALLLLRTADSGHLEQALERIRGERAVEHTNSRVVLSRLVARDPS